MPRNGLMRNVRRGVTPPSPPRTRPCAAAATWCWRSPAKSCSRSRRRLVQAMARTAMPLLRHGRHLRADRWRHGAGLFDELGVDPTRRRLVNSSRASRSRARSRHRRHPRFVLKAGGFGDALALQRILAYFGIRAAPHSAPSAPYLRKHSMERPIVLITMGDPTGVGPEVIVKSVNQPAVRDRLRPLVIGDDRRLRQAVHHRRSSSPCAPYRRPEDALVRPRRDRLPGPATWCRPTCRSAGSSAAGGEAAYRFIARAVEIAQSGFADAICTAPLNKEALHAAGHRYPGPHRNAGAPDAAHPKCRCCWWRRSCA